MAPQPGGPDRCHHLDGEAHALSVFLAWALQVFILRLEGLPAYRACRPSFVRLIVGFFARVGISYGGDVLWFFGKGHPILHG